MKEIIENKLEKLSEEIEAYKHRTETYYRGAYHSMLQEREFLQILLKICS